MLNESNASSVISVISLCTAADGCLENAPDTADFSREFQKHQHLFDPEHDYPAPVKWVSTQSAFIVLIIEYVFK